MQNEEDFAALQFMVSYARNNGNCRLFQAKAVALADGFSQESIDNAVKFWADYEAKKRYR
jgi:hypothetical protein